VAFRTLIRRTPPWLLPLAVLAVGLAVTAGAVRLSSADLEAREQARFSRQAEALKAEVNRRLQLAVNGLSGLRAMHAASGALDTAQLRRYVERRDMAREFPGLRGFGAIEHVPRADLEAFQQRQRDLGHEGFTVRTSGTADDLFVIRAAEPLARNGAAVGFDSGSNPIAREALEHAVETGITSMTAPLTLQQDENQGLGWVLYMPVYRGEPRSVDQRRDSLEAIVFAPLIASELLATVPGEATVNADFRLYDEGARRRLVFDAAPAAAPGERREIWHPMLVGDRVLVLQALSRPDLSDGQGRGMPWLIGIVGGVLAAALALRPAAPRAASFPA
jgi:CHASE1-domain containing sensor protein